MINVTVIKGDKIVLESLSVTIQEDEHIAIPGPNGAGKSSFIKAVNREYYPHLHDDVVFRIRREDVWDVFAIAILFLGSYPMIFSTPARGRCRAGR